MRKIFWPIVATTVLSSLVLVSGANPAVAVGAEPLQQLRTLTYYPHPAPTAINASGSVAGGSPDDSWDNDPHGFVTDPTNSATTALLPLNIDTIRSHNQGTAASACHGMNCVFQNLRT